MRKIRIGYQGIAGSNSEAASIGFSVTQGMKNVEYIPLVNSTNVVDALMAGKIDYGVMASRNHIAGYVKETEDALTGISYHLAAALCLPIHHCLFVKDPTVTRPAVIASHPQALAQCKETLLQEYPDANLKEIEDTAIGARYLSDGTLPDDTGVLCRNNAGEAFGLHLLRENLEDDPTNATDFIIIEKEERKRVPKKTVVVAGLGMIGGSMAKAFKKYTDYIVYGWNRTGSIAEAALREGAIDGIADDAIISKCDLLIPALFPHATIDFLKRVMPTMKSGAQIVDLVGVKGSIIEAVEPIALEYGLRFTGGHPMAGLAKAGYERSFGDLYQGANMILVPTRATEDGDIEELTKLFEQLGFGMVRVCDSDTHDKMIAHTSQLAHVVSVNYVKSPVSVNYVGYTGGSYKDMTRIACLNEKVWKELFILNREALLPEIDRLITQITQVKDAIESKNMDALEQLLREGREAKEAIDHCNPNQPPD